MQVTSTLDTLTKDEWHESIALWLRDCGIKKNYPTGCGIKKKHVIPWDTRYKFIPLRPYPHLLDLVRQTSFPWFHWFQSSSSSLLLFFSSFWKQDEYDKYRFFAFGLRDDRSVRSDRSSYAPAFVRSIPAVSVYRLMEAVVSWWRLRSPVALTIRNEEDSEKILSGKVSLSVEASLPFHFLNFE